MYKNQYFISNCKIDNSVELNEFLFNGLNIYAHPSLSNIKSSEENVQILLLGYIIDPHNPNMSDDAIIQNLSEVCKTKDILFKEIQMLSGRFVLIYKNNTDLIATGDACNSRQIYYSFINNEFILTSSPKMFIDLYGKELMISEIKKEFISSKDFMEHEYAWFGDDTIDDRLKKVLPNHYLDIINKRVFRVPLFFERLVNVEDVLEYSATILKASLEAILKRYKTVFPITAGWDTRVLLAASKEFIHHIEYYVFDHFKVNSNHKDVVIPQKLSAKLGFCFHVIRPGRLREDFLAEFNKEHVFPKILPSTAHIQYHYFKYSNQKVIRICGFGGEISRGRWGNAKFNIDANILQYFSGYNGKYEYVNQAVESWLDESIEYSKKCNIPLHDLFYWEQQMGNWGSMYSFAQDIAIEEFCPYYNKNLLLSITRIDHKERSFFRSAFHKRLIEYLWDEVLCEPINPANPVAKLRGLIGRNTTFRYYKLKTLSLLK